MSNLSFDIDNLATSAPLYLRYPGQTSAQDAYVSLDETGVVSTWVNGNVGAGLPGAMWNGRIQIWRVPSDVNGPCLADMLQGEAAPLLQRVYDGFAVSWVGSNHVGSLDENAQEASEELEYALRSLEDCRTSVWAIEDWLGETSPGELVGEGMTLDSQISEYLESSSRDGVVLDGDASDLRNYILDTLEEAFRSGWRPGHYDGITFVGRPFPARLSALLLAEHRITREEIDERAEEDSSDD